WYRYAPSYVSPAYHLLEGFPFIQEPPSGDLQERVLIRHHDYDQCFQSVQLLQWKIGRAVQQECRDRSRMPSSARKKKIDTFPLYTRLTITENPAIAIDAENEAPTLWLEWPTDC